MYWTSKSIKLFRQDLEDLIAVFRGIDENSTTVLSGEDRKTYESFEDMKSKEGSDITTMVLENRDIGIEVRLLKDGPASVILDAMNHTKESELAFYKAKDFLEAHRRKSGEIVSRIGFWAWGGVTLLTVESFRSHSNMWSAIITICLLISIGIGFGCGKVGKRLSYLVTLDRKHERPPFFERKKDELILVAFASIASATLGILGTLVVQHFGKK